MSERYVVEFARVERFTGWGKPVLDRKRKAEVRYEVEHAPSLDPCMLCQRDKSVGYNRLRQLNPPPRGYLPVQERFSELLLLADLEEKRFPEGIRLRTECSLCRECVGALAADWRELDAAPVAFEETGDEDEASPRRAPFLSNEAAPLAPQKRSLEAQETPQRVAPRFSGLSYRIGDKLAAALALTPHRADAKPLGDEFNVEIVPPLGPLALVRIVADQWSAFRENGAELELDDARVPVLRNIAYGLCDLVAGHQEPTPASHYEDDGEPLPVRLITPSSVIELKVGADFREIAVGILEGTRQYETATTEAIFVRGHWKQQAFGDAGKFRKVIWVQPYYRGKGERGGRTYDVEETKAP